MALGRQLFLALVGLLFGAAGLSAQTPGTVTGRVVEGASQEPLPGVTVTVAERTGVSGPDGRYTVASVPAGTHTLRATRIGFGTVTRQVTVAAGQAATVDLALSSQALLLEEVVAIGYGTQEARDRTGSVEAVTSEEFNTGRIVSPEQLIQSKVAGVQVIDNGEPGGGINIRIRGGTSVGASSEPLFVVDGTPLTVGGGAHAGCTASGCARSPLTFLNPDDIESVTVLKDASATAIYGSRGANGVVIVTTRRGGGGAPSFSYSGSLSSSQVTRRPDLLGAADFRAAVQQYAPSRLSLLGNANTNWVTAVERDAIGQEHNVAVSGSGGSMNYRLSLGYLDQEGVVLGSETERVSGALNYNHLLFSDALNVQVSLIGSRTDDAFTPGGVIGAANAFAPTQPIRTESGAYYEWANTLAPNNPLAELGLVQDHGTTYRGVGNVETRYQLPFVRGLSATGRVGFDITEAERTEFRPTTVHAEVESGANRGFFWQRNPTQTNTVLDLFGNYTSDLGWMDSNLDATAGYSYETSDAEYPEFQADSLASDLLGANGIPGGSGKVRSFLNIEESKLASFFGRVNLSIRDRYLLTLSVRRDGSSRFGGTNQWGTFPSAAFAWRLIDEEFIPEAGWLDDLKLRASWGVNGNQSFGNYLYVSSYRYGDEQARALFGDQWVGTIRPSAVDPNIKWEETTSYNLGLDYAVLGGRLSGSVDYYVKDTDDLLFSVPVAAGTNLSNYVLTNIGSMRNRGVELALSARLLEGGSRGFSWTADFNAAHNVNRLLSINPVGGGAEQIPVGGISGGVGNTIQVLQPGLPVNSFLVYRHRRDSNGDPVADGDGVELTDMYEDLNGDGEITQSDREAFESPSPDWILGHTSNVTFARFDLGFTLRAYLGSHVYNNVASNLGNYAALTNSGGPNNLHSSVLEYGFDDPQYFSDVYVEDASFLRMDNITLGYRVPARSAFRDLRVYGTVQNAFTLTGYSGVDPTAGLNGIDNNLYPRSRTFSAGVSLGF
ncbi:MAG TPA: SusC/RagA family TonB-linked outer membrane protein [Longimicrobium sp.]|jgi:iron complex outermembrane receptor protein|uniref:SusC/RagA family TonB-linked outer membrane protein n=1 Tax=Longimicrobium sp. TaxID=2029185 RepID=UPI002EDAA73F